MTRRLIISLTALLLTACDNTPMPDYRTHTLTDGVTLCAPQGVMTMDRVPNSIEVNSLHFRIKGPQESDVVGMVWSGGFRPHLDVAQTLRSQRDALEAHDINTAPKAHGFHEVRDVNNGAFVWLYENLPDVIMVREEEASSDEVLDESSDSESGAVSTREEESESEIIVSQGNPSGKAIAAAADDVVALESQPESADQTEPDDANTGETVYPEWKKPEPEKVSVSDEWIFANTVGKCNYNAAPNGACLIFVHLDGARVHLALKYKYVAQYAKLANMLRKQAVPEKKFCAHLK